MSDQQDTVMMFDPATGEPRPWPSHASQYRKWHGSVAWLHCPWTGKRRNPRDIGSDVFGQLMIPPGETIKGEAR